MDELRIGTRERELAMGALDEHMRAGRLDPTEYAERSSVASTARFRSELDALFTDLPAPYPAYPPTAASADGGAGSVDRVDPDAGSTSARAATTPRERPAEDRSEKDLPELVAPIGARLGRHAGSLSALAPVLAFALFVLTGFRFPQVFLLVPVAIALLSWLGHRHGG